MNTLAVMTDVWKINARQMFVELNSKLLLTEIAKVSIETYITAKL